MSVGRVARGYWPLTVGLAVVAAVIVVAPSTTPEALVEEGAEAGVVAQTASGWGDGVGYCGSEDEPQVAGDPYAPPCFAFTGDNGGDTSKGVTADTITVTYRQTAEPNALALLAQLMGIEFDETAEDFQRTFSGLVEYFNESFQMYGRQIDLQNFDGQGLLTNELTGGGREAASVDGLRSGREIEAFADVTATSQPYAEALAANGTVSFGAPYMSRRWFVEHRPYAWSITPDCSLVAEAASEYGLRRLIGRPAVFAGDALEGEPRRLAVISPNNAEYQRCAEDGLAVVDDAGQSVDYVTDYVLDLGRIPNQATAIAAELVRRGITTISCFCDPLMLINLTQQIDAQGLQPEWIVTGTGFSDLDLIGQGLAKANGQWNRAFGASPLALQPTREDSPGYRAFKSVRPDEEPSLAVDVFYYQLYQLVLGIQMAGPDLTPLTLETGLFSYPEHTGPAGTWDMFPETEDTPASYTPITDLREVWWDPDATSPFNGQPGTYASTDVRFGFEDLESTPDEVLDQQPAVFPDGIGGEGS